MNRRAAFVVVVVAVCVVTAAGLVGSTSAPTGAAVVGPLLCTSTPLVDAEVELTASVVGIDGDGDLALVVETDRRAPHPRPSTYSLVDLDAQGAEPLGLPVGAVALAITDDGARVLYRTAAGLGFLHVADGALHPLGSSTFAGAFAGMAGDGSIVLFTQGTAFGAIGLENSGAGGISAYDTTTEQTETVVVSGEYFDLKLTNEGTRARLLRNGHLEVLDLESGSTTQLSPTYTSFWFANGTAARAEVDADASQAYFVSSDDGGSNPDRSAELWHLDVGTGTTTPLTDDHHVHTTRPLVSADGETVVFAAAGGVWRSASGGAPEQVLEAGTLAGRLSADGTGLAAPVIEPGTSDHSTAWLVDLDDGSRLEAFGARPTSTPTISAAGDVVAFASSADVDGSNPDGGSEIWIREGPTTRSLLDGVQLASSADPSLSRDGASVAFTSSADPLGANPDGNREVFLAAVDHATVVEQLTSSSGIESVDRPRLSGDGSTVVFESTAVLGTNTDGSLEVFLRPTGGAPAVQVSDEADAPVEAFEVGVSPDASIVAYASTSVGVVRWTAGVGRELLAAEGEHPIVLPDGTVLYQTPSGWAWAAPGEPPDPAPAPLPAGLEGPLAASANGRYVYTVEGRPSRFDLLSGGTTSFLHDAGLDLVATSAAGGWIVGRASDPYVPVLAECPVFQDVALGHPFSSEIDGLSTMGVIGGFPDQTFRPSASVTRQAMAAFLYRLAGADEPTPATDPFDDVSTTHPFATEIAWASNEGITTGFDDGTFRPAAIVTRQAAAAFLHRLIDPTYDPPDTATFTDVSTSHPFFAEIEWAADEQITTGYPDHTFRPAGIVTRQAAAAFLHRTEPLL